MKQFLTKYSIVLALCLFGITSATPLFATPRPGATDWYIESFNADITVNPDGGLHIKEDILADCGQCSNKHGIFRIVPERIKTKEGNTYLTPIYVSDITDEQGTPYTYTESKSTRDGTVTWKIGDADTTVQGEHHYVIDYTVERAVRDQTSFDELYWNLVGGFWDLEMDQVHATVHIPTNLDAKDIKLFTYAGPQGKNENSSDWITSRWTDDHTLVIDSVQPFPDHHDATVSFSFPKGVITAYAPSSADQLSGIMMFLGYLVEYGIGLLPLLVLVICFLQWRKYGKDPVVKKTIIAEYEAPDGLSPLMMRLLQTYGKLDKQAITAGIIDLAIQNVLIIKETKPARLLAKAEYSLTQRPESEWKRALSKTEQVFLNALFPSGELSETNISFLKETFHGHVSSIQKVAEQELAEMGYISKGKNTVRASTMSIAGVIVGYIGYMLFADSWMWGVSVMVSGGLLLLFSALMKQYTPKGAETMWKIKGFKLFMNTVEKYRQQWNEKQNFFEAMLPYAIAFDMTKQWISKMKDIGAMPATGYMPLWYIGTMNFSSFDELASNISSISSEISSNVTTSSGSSGGGFSGGGGGGGGGGGW